MAGKTYTKSQFDKIVEAYVEKQLNARNKLEDRLWRAKQTARNENIYKNISDVNPKQMVQETIADAVGRQPPVISDDMLFDMAKKPSKIASNITEGMAGKQLVPSSGVKTLTESTAQRTPSILDELLTKSASSADDIVKSVKGEVPSNLPAIIEEAVASVSGPEGKAVSTGKSLFGKGLQFVKSHPKSVAGGALAGLVALNALLGDGEEAPVAPSMADVVQGKSSEGVKSKGASRGRLGTDNPALDEAIIKALIESGTPRQDPDAVNLYKAIMHNA